MITPDYLEEANELLEKALLVNRTTHTSSTGRVYEGGESMQPDNPERISMERKAQTYVLMDIAESLRSIALHIELK